MPERIVLTGFMGAGKTTSGVRLARELGWSFIDLDEEIARAEQKSIAFIFESAGENSFRELEHLALRSALRQRNIVLALGGGAVETAANRQLLTEDIHTLLIYLESPLDVLIDRCEHQQSLQSEAARRPVLEKRLELTERFLRRQPLYESAHWTIETSGRTPEEVARAIFTRWQEQVMGQSI